MILRLASGIAGGTRRNWELTLRLRSACLQRGVFPVGALRLRSGGPWNRPGLFDAAFLLTRYRSEMGMLAIPAVVQRCFRSHGYHRHNAREDERIQRRTGPVLRCN